MNAASHEAAARGQSLRDAVQQFGFPIERFIPGRSAARALRIAGVIDVALGIGVSVWAHFTERHWALLVAGVGLVLSGILVILLSRRFAGGGVLICPRGLIVAGSGRVQSVAWDQMRSIADTGAAAASLPNASRHFSIEQRDGSVFQISAAAVGDVTHFAEVLKRESSRRKVAWKTA